MSAERFTDNDYELLSAYIDGMLDDAERSALERRLEQEPDLRRELAAIRQTVALINDLPQLTAPRNFTLTREMLQSAPPQTVTPRLLPSPRKANRFQVLTTLSAAAATLLMVAGIVTLLIGGSAGDDMPTAADAGPGQVAFSNTGELPTNERLTAVAAATQAELTGTPFEASRALSPSIDVPEMASPQPSPQTQMVPPGAPPATGGGIGGEGGGPPALPESDGAGNVPVPEAIIVAPETPTVIASPQIEADTAAGMDMAEMAEEETESEDSTDDSALADTQPAEASVEQRALAEPSTYSADEGTADAELEAPEAAALQPTVTTEIMPQVAAQPTLEDRDIVEPPVDELEIRDAEALSTDDIGLLLLVTGTIMLALTGLAIAFVRFARRRHS